MIESASLELMGSWVCAFPIYLSWPLLMVSLRGQVSFATHYCSYTLPFFQVKKKVELFCTPKYQNKNKRPSRLFFEECFYFQQVYKSSGCSCSLSPKASFSSKFQRNHFFSFCDLVCPIFTDLPCVAPTRRPPLGLFNSATQGP